MNSLKLVLLTATFMLAITFTISCSSNDDDEGGGGSSTESYALRDVTDSSFTYVETEEYDRCKEGGTLEKETREYPEDISYSISNKVLAWKYRWSADDSLNFAGSSNTLTGTWTRTKNKNASCETRTDYDGDTYLNCKSGWRIVKAEFTTSTLKITTDYCPTDYTDESEERDGWKMRVVDCNTFEVYKGTDKVIMKQTETRSSANISATYKGKTCTISWSERTKSQKEKACKKAWDEYGSTDEYWSDYYWDFLYEEEEEDIEAKFDECLKKNGFPEVLFKDDDDYYGAVSAKPLLKKQAKLR